jgi:O-antigen ligase
MPYAVGAALLLPFYVGLLQPVLQYGADLLQFNSFVSRGKDVNQLVDFEGRRATWAGSIRFWTDHFPGIRQFLVGFGYQGHVKSGAYLYIPRDNSMFLRDRSALHAHNSVLQAQFEVGLIGSTLLFAVTILLVYRYGRSAELLPAFAATAMIGLSGVVEPSLTPGILHIEAFMILYLAFFTPVKSIRAVGPSAGKNNDPTDRGLPRDRPAHPMVDLR